MILLNASQTLSKSIGFGATKKSPPNAERWVQRHWREPLPDFGPTLDHGKKLVLYEESFLIFYNATALL